MVVFGCTHLTKTGGSSSSSTLFFFFFGSVFVWPFSSQFSRHTTRHLNASSASACARQTGDQHSPLTMRFARNWLSRKLKKLKKINCSTVKERYYGVPLQSIVKGVVMISKIQSPPIVQYVGITGVFSDRKSVQLTRGGGPGGRLRPESSSSSRTLVVELCWTRL